MSTNDRPIQISLIAPAHNEAANLATLVDEIESVLTPRFERFECLLVDDRSTDDTQGIALSLAETRPWLRVIAIERTNRERRGAGQSAAFLAGIRAARGELIATIDADLQNDVTDLPRLVALLESTGADLVQGDRSAVRRDSFGRRVASAVGRASRRWIVGDGVRDTGCSLRVMRRAVALALPLQFRGMHRFIPACARMHGYRVVEAPVNHRPRVAGVPKYGVFNRALPGLVDCFAARWMQRRIRAVDAHELTPTSGAASSVEAPSEHSSQDVEVTRIGS